MISFNEIQARGYNFFTGVPDSLLKGFIYDLNQSKEQHIIATHESQALGLAVGAELAGKKSCVYLQNSGLGNLVNPITSLCLPYNIKPLLVIGHRHTLPQHKVMGEIDEKLLHLMRYDNFILVRGDNNVN
ncbi:MAG: sulfopyruvate decarboxylase subunit alpha [Gammaproteobacteria bacterium]|nr:sulfopyruvate decarboxylase subunit alpha [Gammaproteobacteria bacterium]MCH9743475.1 sulfopyruvate decarboxylase subunit alpha [Gammaproteobacteria bacterium]